MEESPFTVIGSPHVRDKLHRGVPIPLAKYPWFIPSPSAVEVTSGGVMAEIQRAAFVRKRSSVPIRAENAE